MPVARFAAVGGLLLLLGAPPAEGSADQGLNSVQIRGIPHVRQKPDFCGEACAEMHLRKLGYDIDQDAVFDQSGLDPKLGRGCYTRDLARALRRVGFDPGKVWHTANAGRAEAELDGLFRELHNDLLEGVPSIICMRFDEKPRTTEHFRLVVGYDAEADEVIYHEPAARQGAYRRMSRRRLLKLWPLKYETDRWTVVRMPLRVDRIAAIRTSQAATDADYAQHIMQLNQKLPDSGFTVVVQKPFVVVGDESPATVRKRSVRTIKWAVDHLKRDYFEKDPAEILDIWLFKDKASYEKHTKALFGDRPTTPFGYYSARHRALIMNIATGGGTLVHEIVHPFMAANFPDCPAWFNEGLASLYEQCGQRNGKIYGYTNWRLQGLKQAIEKGRVPSFKTLTGTTTQQFYHEDPGTNYAQARYLCYYLQEQGLLRKFYHAFRRSAHTDPGGYQALKEVLGEEDMAAFQKRWEAFVTKLQ